ncbi:hypothetical protein HYU21_02255 [Candidatus Woesearchaeota archaeon]|nr:hypothetical protein [Candidatus Woesearchaeota archaeon]
MKLKKTSKTSNQKKASADMWWIIIGAVMALVALTIILLIFNKQTGPASQQFSNCESKGGVCASSGSECPSFTLESSAFECSSGTCCLGAPKKCTEDKDCNSGTENDKRCTDFGTKRYCR